MLTGVGIDLPTTPPRLLRVAAAALRARGAVRVQPRAARLRRQDGARPAIAGEGLAEIDAGGRACCAASRATARFISGKIATLLPRRRAAAGAGRAMAATFERTDGDIAAVLRDDVPGPDLPGPLGASRPAAKFKDPMQFVVSSLRLAYDGTAHHQLPAGRALAAAARRAALRPGHARRLPADRSGLDQSGPDGRALRDRPRHRQRPRRAVQRPRTASPAADRTAPGARHDVLPAGDRAALSARHARGALAATSSQQEWNMVLLASPEWMQR